MFLSTARHSDLFSPETRSACDTSARIKNTTSCTLDPILEISFGDLVYTVPEDTDMLQQTADMALNAQSRSSASSLLPTTSGFESCWDAMLDRDVTCSAHGPREAEAAQWYNWASEDWSRFLVCLSGDRRRGEICHRRRVQRVRTPSSRGYCSYEHTMANHSDLNNVDRGQRGELVKALLTMQACDAAGATSRNRWVSVDSFLKELLSPSQYDSLHGSYPGFWYVDERQVSTRRS